MNRPIRIAVPIHSFEPGGVERVALNLAEAWQEAGAEVTIILGRGDGAMARSAPKLAYQMSSSPISTASFETMWMIAQLWRHLRANKSDILFCPGNTYGIVAVAMRLLLGAECPPVVAKISNDLARKDMPRLFRPAYRFWLRLQGRQFDKIVGMAEPMRAEIRDAMRVRGSDITVINDPSLTLAQYNRLSYSPRRQARAAPSKMLAIGRLTSQKNFPLMIRAFAETASSTSSLTILGEGPERSRLERLIYALGVERQVHLPGHIDDTAPWLQSCTAFLLSSDYEGVPAVIVEALAAGMPIIATDCSVSMKQLLGNGRFGALVAVGDRTAFAAAIAGIAGQSFDQTGAIRSAKSYCIESASRHYLNCFVSVSDDDGQAFDATTRCDQSTDSHETFGQPLERVQMRVAA